MELIELLGHPFMDGNKRTGAIGWDSQIFDEHNADLIVIFQRFFLPMNTSALRAFLVW